MVDGREKTEAALRESEGNYRMLFDRAGEGMLVADIETMAFRYANPAICEMLGYTRDELTEMDVTAMHPKASLERVIAEFQAQARGEKALVRDVPCLRKDGTVVYADIRTTRVDIEGRPCNVGFFADVTEHRRDQAIIQEQARALDLCFRYTLDCVVLLDWDLARTPGHRRH